MGDSGEWGADTQDRHHGVPELEGGGGRVLRCRIPRGGDRFWTVFGQVLGGFETGIFFEIAIIR